MKENFFIVVFVNKLTMLDNIGILNIRSLILMRTYIIKKNVTCTRKPYFENLENVF